MIIYVCEKLIFLINIFVSNNKIDIKLQMIKKVFGFQMVIQIIWQKYTKKSKIIKYQY